MSYKEGQSEEGTTRETTPSGPSMLILLCGFNRHIWSEQSSHAPKENFWLHHISGFTGGSDG